MNSTFISICFFFLITFNFTQQTIAQDNVLLKIETDQNFSSPDSKDLFQLILVGDSVYTGEVTFNIISADGDTLLNHIYSADDFNMKYAYETDVSIDLITKEITNNINSFFNPTNFNSPAIGKNESINNVDEDYSDLDIWKDIQSD